VFAHALAHLAGYDHQNDLEELKMEKFVGKLLMGGGLRSKQTVNSIQQTGSRVNQMHN
jgi:ssRNA-specific RNase YbeY (16S rRNA maturation enzyme)